MKGNVNVSNNLLISALFHENMKDSPVLSLTEKL